MRRGPRICIRVALLAALLGARIASAGYTEFESDVVRPLALSADGTRLFAVNTPDARLEVLRVTDAGLAPEASIPVGLEPVSVAVRSPDEVWVVNHLSDSVSVVDVSAVPPRVTRAPSGGDEPRDVVFAGPARARSSRPPTAGRTARSTPTSSSAASAARTSGCSTRTRSVARPAARSPC
jgi:DNA-binding beta-propeller fold protein YncE